MLGLPALAGLPEEESLLEDGPAAWRELAARGKVGVLNRAEPRATPEAAWLGLDPAKIALAQGPLTVSALEADPPPRSVQFHLSLMSFEDGMASPIALDVPEKELRIVLEQAHRLNTRALTIVPGEGIDHGLVWENGSLDLRTVPQPRVVIQDLPEGDGERMLRRFIDDSINLLSELELNRRRRDEGLPTLNLLWMWGQGMREPVPNLWIERGTRAWVESRSLRLRGLARLVGYRHGPRAFLGRGLGAPWETVLQAALERDAMVIMLDSFAKLREAGRMDEARWVLSDMGDGLVAPLLPEVDKAELRLVVVCPHEHGRGLWLWAEKGTFGDDPLPFDERALDESTADSRETWEVVAAALG